MGILAWWVRQGFYEATSRKKDISVDEDPTVNSDIAKYENHRRHDDGPKG
jgi:hypothetical protein